MHFECQVLRFQQGQNPNAVGRVEPVVPDVRGQRFLAGVAERRVTDVMTKADRLGQVLVEAEGSRHRPADLGDLEGVGEAGDEVIAFRIDEHLGLVLQPAEGLGVDDAVPVPLEGGSVLVGLFGHLPSPAVRRSGAGRSEEIVLHVLPLDSLPPSEKLSHRRAHT